MSEKEIKTIIIFSIERKHDSEYRFDFDNFIATDMNNKNMKLI